MMIVGADQKPNCPHFLVLLGCSHISWDSSANASVAPLVASVKSESSPLVAPLFAFKRPGQIGFLRAQQLPQDPIGPVGGLLGQFDLLFSRIFFFDTCWAKHGLGGFNRKIVPLYYPDGFFLSQVTRHIKVTSLSFQILTVSLLSL